MDNKKKPWSRPRLMIIDVNQLTNNSSSPTGIDGFVGDTPPVGIGS